LKDFKNDNIVYLYQAFREAGKLFLVFEYLEKTVLDDLELSPDGLDVDYIKAIMYQLLLATVFMHDNRIVHRDIKPENLLLSTSGLLKVCDFGFARELNEDKNFLYTDYVSTRWYRAPELLVGDAAYDETVDVWAIGCIVAELYNGQPLFPGDSDLHTLQLILEA
jgi:cyclin-dependent kinase-like